MKYYVSLVIFFICFQFAQSNDGAFISEGINIYPFKETVIELKKEFLNLQITYSKMYVDVYFEFNNPTQKNKKLLVGFVAPPPQGDVSGIKDSDLIKDFKVECNNKLLPSEYHRIGVLDSNRIGDDDMRIIEKLLILSRLRLNPV